MVFMMDNSYFIERTDSTNALLKRLSQEKHCDNFFMVYTHYQTAGRGMGVNVWQSNDGENVLASFLFHLSLLPREQFIFNQLFALATRQTVADYLDDVTVKWPNDIYVGENKIAGLLIEHTVCNDSITQTVAGIGLNVNQTVFDSSIPNPISLKMATNRDYQPEEVLKKLRLHVQQYYKLAETGRVIEIQKEYEEKLYRRNKTCTYIIGDKKTAATIIGVNRYGQLMLEDISGQKYCCNRKEIQFVK